MPPRYKYSKDEIISAAISLIEEEGSSFLTARNLANRLKATPKIIFDSFKNMEDLNKEVYASLIKEFGNKTILALESNEVPSYITAPMVYIDYAREKKYIFEYLFIKHELPSQEAYLDAIYRVIASKSHLKYEDAKEVHFRYFLFVHGLADLLAKGKINLDKDSIIEMLESNYKNLVTEFKNKEK